jgi:hypothetical protein
MTIFSSIGGALHHRMPRKLTWLMLLMSTLSLAVKAQLPDCSKYPFNLPNGPQLHDALGWSNPVYSSSIRTGDIDGDGQTDLIARDSSGIHVWRHEGVSWVEKSPGPALTDHNNWGRPEYVSTLQLAVLDASTGQADLVARGPDGVHVWRYNRANSGWDEVGGGLTSRPFPDAADTDWTQAKHYSTIQLGDLDRDGQAELIGRGQSGLETFRWNQSTNSWERIAITSEFSDDKGFSAESS